MLYAESSAVLSWLLGEPEGEPCRVALAGSDRVATSQVTLLECERALLRAARSGRLGEADAATARRLLALASVQWTTLAVSSAIIEAAKRPLPSEPVRSLDALHLATAVAVRAAVGAVTLLSLDDRVRVNASALGFPIAPPR